MEPNNPKEETTSRPNHLKLISLEVEAYAGLNLADKVLVVHFPENERITEFSGDQGVGKTSLMNGLKALMGEPEPGNAINGASGKKGATLTFEKGGNRYQARLTKTTFTLNSLQEGEDGKIIISTVKKPKDIIADLIGPVGVSPDFLTKKKSGQEQIEWIKSLAANNKDVAGKEQELQNKYNAAYKDRTEANRDFARLKTELLATGYCKWEDDNSVLINSDKYSAALEEVAKAPENDVEIKTSYDTAFKANSELERAKDRLQQLNNSKEQIATEVKEIDRQIEALMLRKQNFINEDRNTDESIAAARVYIKEREEAPDALKTATEQMNDAGRITVLRNGLHQFAQKKGEFTKTEKRQEELNTQLVECEKAIQQLAKDVTPDIEGLEVVVGNIDSKKPEGVYFNGVNMSALSESELWDLCLQIWKLTGTAVVYIENSSSLGTDALHRVNWFAEKGGHVFISTMQRGYKELKVSFHKEKE